MNHLSTSPLLSSWSCVPFSGTPPPPNPSLRPQLRNFQNKVSRDADIVVAAMVSIVGSTLIFQGWRLDPLLLLCQALTTSVAFWYGLETFRLRSKEADMVSDLGRACMGVALSWQAMVHACGRQGNVQRRGSWDSAAAGARRPGCIVRPGA